LILRVKIGFLILTIFLLDLDEPISLGWAFSSSEERTMTSGVGRPGRFRVGDVA
jgi:hypothetical protein